MTVEELMQPRYEVIADYPHSPYNVGDLVEIADSGTSFHCITTKEYNGYTDEFEPVVHCFDIKQIDKYPHLFRRLEWWEKRNKNDMPGFLRIEETGKIGKVDKWDKDLKGASIGRYWWAITHTRVLPATEQEYTDYLISKK